MILSFILFVLCLLATVGAAFLVIGANMMSDAPSVGFQGTWIIAIPAAFAVLFFVVWWFGG